MNGPRSQSIRLACAARHARWRAAFSLLEVILALAILAGAVAVIGEMVRIGTRSAAAARDSTQAQLLCEGVLAQLQTGYLPLTGVSNVPCESALDWDYSVTVEPTFETGLLAVTVTVRDADSPAPRPLEFSITQWIRDPAQIPVDDESTDASANGAGGSSSSSTSGGTGASS